MHECVIGMLQKWDEKLLVTLEDLEEEIENNIKYVDNYLAIKGFKPCHVYTLKDYGDMRKSTDLTRFYHCPECGKKIDWAMIRRIGKESKYENQNCV